MRGAAKANISGFYGQQGRIGFKANPYPPRIAGIKPAKLWCYGGALRHTARKNIFSVLKSAQNRKGWLGGVIE